MLFLQSFQLIQLALPEVLALQHLLFASRPVLMDVGLVLELLSKMFQTFQPHHFRQKPFFK
jgi:hypothetical protein